jgi:hypothetical protein
MARGIAGAVGGFVAWFIVATVLNLVLRWWWPGYADAERPMTFTLPMLAARLVVGALSSLGAGFVLARIAKRAGRPAVILGIVLLAVFIPVHYGLWDKFSVWYHAAFLASLVPFVVLGAFASAKREQEAAGGRQAPP